MPLAPPQLDDGLVAVVKQDCPTCHLVVPVLEELKSAGVPLTVVSQDDPTFPLGLDPIDDRDLEISYRLQVEAVPTLFRLEGGQVRARQVGWNRREWQLLTENSEIGRALPEYRPGCGSRSVEPGVAERLRRRFEGTRLESRQVSIGSQEDAVEACFSRGWTDGLPVVPPTPERVEAMLEGTSRAPGDVVAVVPPDLAECSVEKIAINAVMAGCRAEYLPVVIAAVGAACTDEFNMHGLAATTMAMGPVVIVNGPIRRKIGMNSGINALGQGNRANATIGRALQLVIRNVGGARPGDVDRATFGNPGKYTFCFAEDEEGSPWDSLAVETGVAEDVSAVTLFAGEGPHVVVDQKSRQPESLARSLAGSLRAMIHPKLARAFDALVVVSPEHARVFAEAGWSKQRLRDEILEILTLPREEMIRGAGGCAEGIPESVSAELIPKFQPDGLLFVHAGGKAGLFSMVIGGWVRGPGGTMPVTREIVE